MIFLKKYEELWNLAQAAKNGEFKLLIQRNLFRREGGNSAFEVNKKWLLVQRKIFDLFLKQPSTQLVDNCTCFTILLYRYFLDWYLHHHLLAVWQKLLSPFYHCPYTHQCIF
jgi:hypothetical protein